MPKGIKKIICNTLRKKRQTSELEIFEESVKPPELTIFPIDVSKLEKDSPLTTWTFKSPLMTGTNWKKVQH